jgi:hypothetical protein
MPTYRVQYRTDAAFAETTVDADSINEAFAVAQNLDPEALVFEPYTSTQPVNEIAVRGPNGIELTWRSDDMLLRLAAEELLIAAKNVLTALKEKLLAEGCERAILCTLRHLKDAIDTAEGRKA